MLATMDCACANNPTITGTWHGCYDTRWNDLIVREAFTHPAKFSPNLIKRIYAHGFERRYWSKYDLIGDPFAGIAAGGIMAGYYGLHWCGVEVEQAFVDVGEQNLRQHRRRWDGGSAQIMRGDSTRFAEIINHVDAIVTSPPFNDQTPPSSPVPGSGRQGVAKAMKAAGVDHHDHWGKADAQIGTLAGEAYWSAITSVYAQCLASLRPGGVMCVVVKDHVRDHVRVPLCDLTLDVLMRLGFEPIERIRAMLVREFSEPSVFGGDIKTTRSRKSFFRRIHEANGEPAIDWEEVLFLKRGSHES